MSKLLIFWNKIKSLDSRVIAFIGGAILVLFMLQQCNTISSLKEDLNKSKERAENNLNNYIALTDTVKYYENKNGDLIAEVKSYVFTVEDFKKANYKLLDKYILALNLNKDLKGINSLLKTEINLKDSLLANSTIQIINDTTKRIKFAKTDNFGKGNTRNIKGSVDVFETKDTSYVSNTKIIIDQNVTLLASLETTKNGNIVKITSEYPGLKINSIENINLINNKLNANNTNIDKKAGWSIGMGIGYGINLNNNQKISYGPSINLGLYWSPKWLRF